MTVYDYNSVDLAVPIELTQQEEFLLKKSQVFCMYPWMHLHAYPTGEVYPCCFAEMSHSVGNCRKNSLQEIWQNDTMQQLRHNMLNEIPSSACSKCYEQEASGFFSGRRSANKHHGHHIHKLEHNPFEMVYWDIRFSNLCNLSCRSCGHIFSSSWHRDQKKLVLKSYWENVKGPDWPNDPPETSQQFDALNDNVKKELIENFGGEILRLINQVRTLPILNYAGRSETDMWEQLIPHLDYVEQIYFAGGEPLMMAEHYNILDELERRQRFDVALIYNTNFTQVKLKDRYVFDYWKKFKSVSVGASLDASWKRGEYIRKGSDWAVIEDNRKRMLDTCPNVDFYISPTLSIMNAWHLPDFHQDWVNRGFIEPKDVNVNILQDPDHYRIDTAPAGYKQQLKQRFENHLDWLRDQDPLQRATVGYESAVKFMMATDNSHLLEKFWKKTAMLDSMRNENIFDALPELKMLND